MTAPTATTDSWTGSAWSCTVRLVVVDERALRPAAADLQALLARVDAAASRFRPDSALSIANSRAGRPTPIPALLVDLVAAALDAAAQTDGAVDPTVGLAMARLGYDRDIGDISAEGLEPAPVVPTRDWRAVRLDRGAGLLRVPVGTALDLGATAKAWTADHAAQTLAVRYGTGVLVELGGDVAVAGPAPQGWCLRVAEHAGGEGQLVRIRHGGMATSTTTIRTWRRSTATMHHIVDPTTGRPTDGPWRTVTVAATSALAANTASTAAIVRGDLAPARLAERGLAARLVARDGTIITTAGWPSAAPAAQVFPGPGRLTGTAPNGSGEKQVLATAASSR